MAEESTNQRLTDDGSFNKYFHILLNMCDDDLDPYSYRLLGHYRRVCGQHGTCSEAIKTTAHKCKMSLAKARSSRDALRQQGYINFDEQLAGRTIVITIIDRMAENIQRYANVKTKRATKNHTPTKNDSPTPTKNESPGLPNSIAKEEPVKNGKEHNTFATPLASRAKAEPEKPLPTTITPIRQPSIRLAPVPTAKAPVPSKPKNGTAESTGATVKPAQPTKRDLIFEWVCSDVLHVSLEDIKVNKHLRGRANTLKATIVNSLQIRSDHPDQRPSLDEQNEFAPKLPGMKIFWAKEKPGMTFPTGNGTFGTLVSQWFEAGCSGVYPPHRAEPEKDYDLNCPNHCDNGHIEIINEFGQRSWDYCTCMRRLYKEHHGVELKRP